MPVPNFVKDRVDHRSGVTACARSFILLTHKVYAVIGRVGVLHAI